LICRLSSNTIAKKSAIQKALCCLVAERRHDPDVCQALLTLLSEGMLEIQQAQKALLHKKKQLAVGKTPCVP
jgi:hypothetical protein